MGRVIRTERDATSLYKIVLVQLSLVMNPIHLFLSSSLTEVVIIVHVCGGDGEPSDDSKTVSM